MSNKTYIFTIKNDNLYPDFADDYFSSEEVTYFPEILIEEIFEDNKSLKLLLNGRHFRNLLHKPDLKKLFDYSRYANSDDDEYSSNIAFENFLDDNLEIGTMIALHHQDLIGKCLDAMNLQYCTVGYSPWATVTFPKGWKNKQLLEDVWEGNRFYFVDCKEFINGQLEDYDSCGCLYTPELNDGFINVVKSLFGLDKNDTIYIEQTDAVRYNEFKKYKIKELVPDSFKLE